MAGENQYHVLRVTINIRRVVLAVRFPCALQFQLRNDGHTVDSRLSYELKDGKCQPNEKLATDIEITNKQSQYPQKKINLVVLMASSNGKIPAGSIQLKVSEKGKLAEHPNNQSFAIEKCPDKSAHIEINMKVEYIRSFHRETVDDKQRILSPSSQSVYQRLNQRSKTRKMITPEKFKTKSSFQKMLSESDSPKAMLSKPKISDQASHGEASIIQQQLLLNEPEAYYQQKLLKISKQKDNYLRQISSLKAQINSLRRQQQWRNGTSEDQISKYRSQIDNLTQQLSTLKEKFKNLERKQKETSNQNRDMKEQLDKNRTKMVSVQASQEELKRNLYEKQKQVKKLQQQLKQLKQQLQDTKMTLNSQQKRIQYKQQTYKQQLSKLTQKFHQSESQRQKSTLQLNNMLTSFQASQKKAQLQIKQKERAHQDEKNRLSKKIEMLTVNLKELRECKEDLEGSLEEVRAGYGVLSKSKEEVVLELKDLTAKYESLQILSRKQQNTISQLITQQTHLTQSLHSHQTLQKKHLQLQSQSSKCTESLTRMTQKNDTLTKSLRELEHTLKQTLSARDAANAKCNQIGKELQRVKKVLEGKELEMGVLEETVGNWSGKVGELRVRLDGERLDAENARNKSQAQILYLIRTKDQLLSQIEQLKWKLSKSEQSNSALSQKLSTLNQQLLKQTEQHLTHQQHSSTLTESLKQLQSKLDTANSQLLSKQSKQKQLLTIIRNKSDLQFQLRKIIKEKEQEVFILKEKEKQAGLHSKEKIEQMEAVGKDREEGMERMGKELDNLRNQNKELGKNLESVGIKMARVVEESQAVKRELVEAKQMGMNLEIQLENKNRKIEEFEKMAISWLKKEQDLTTKLQVRQQALSKTKQQWQKFRNETCTAFQHFLQQLHKDNITNPKESPSTITTSPTTTTKPTTKSVSLTQLIAFPDTNMSLLQVQAFKKRQEQLYKIKEQMTAYQEEILLGNMEVERWKGYLKEREEELEGLLMAEKERVKQLLAEHLSQKNSLSQKLSLCQESLLSQTLTSQKSLLQLTHQKQQSLSLDQQLQSSKQQITNLQQKIKQLTKTIENINMTQTQYKCSNQSQALAVAEENRSLVEKLRAVNKDLERRIGKMGMEMQGVEENLRRVEQEMGGLQHAKEKLQKKLQFSQSRISQLLLTKKTLQSQLSTCQKTQKTQLSQIQKLSTLLQTQQYKVSDLTLKLSKSNQDILALEFDKNQLQKAIQELNANLKDVESYWRKVEDGYKGTVGKLGDTVGELRERVIMLGSEVDLKEFLIKQLQASCAQAKNQANQYLKQIAQKRTNTSKLQQQLQNLKNQLIFLHQNFQSLTSQKTSLQTQHKKQKQLLQQLTTQTMQQSVISELLATKQRQYIRLKEDYDSLESKLDYTVRDYRQALADMRKEISGKSVKEEELKRRIREMEKELSHKVYQLTTRNEKNREDGDRDRLELIRSVELLESENSRLRSECQYLRQQLLRQTEQTNQQCSQLTKLLTQKQQQLASKSQLLKQQQKKIKILSNELKNCLQSWQREKSQLKLKGGEIPENGQLSKKFQKLIEDIDGRGKGGRGGVGVGVGGGNGKQK